MTQIPRGAERQLAWLVDRACIAELIMEYNRALDEKDVDAIVACYTEDGMLEVPFGNIPAKDLAAAAPGALALYDVTHHLSGAHSIVIDGDTAKCRVSSMAVHVPSAARRGEHGDVGGWYHITLRRVDGRWRVVTVRGDFLWTLGDKFPRKEEQIAALPQRGLG